MIAQVSQDTCLFVRSHCSSVSVVLFLVLVEFSYLASLPSHPYPVGGEVLLLFGSPPPPSIAQGGGGVVSFLKASLCAKHLVFV